ncbi:hypothetical protein Fmac_018964 [Flemingia macrophylla]|uniref:BAH domain-containing protein n=1 Tax=Flemingia macrophylla TaxID=520843 RepID=A0ABD1M760_9FABA
MREIRDCVLMHPDDTNKPPYVARVEKIERDNENNVNVHVRWYYRPEDSSGGRRKFHGEKELFLSDHYDIQSANTIEGKFEYKPITGTFTPDSAVVYCKCEMPYNPDQLMVQCEHTIEFSKGVKHHRHHPAKNKGEKRRQNHTEMELTVKNGLRRYHPACVGITIEEAHKLDYFICSECLSHDDMEKHQATFPISPSSDGKVRPPKFKN